MNRLAVAGISVIVFLGMAASYYIGFFRGIDYALARMKKEIGESLRKLEEALKEAEARRKVLAMIIEKFKKEAL